MSGCCLLWSWSPDRAPLVALLARDPPPLKPVIAAADNTVSLSLMADSPVFTTSLTVLGTVVSLEEVVVGDLVAVGWAALVTVVELVEVPAIVVAAVLVVAGEGVSLGRGGGMDGRRGGGREELNCSHFNSVFKPVFKTVFACIFSLAAFNISISLGWKCSAAAVLHVPQAALHKISCFIAPRPVELICETCILSFFLCSSGVAAKTLGL